MRADLEEEINGTKGLVMVGFRWKDVERFETVREAAASCSREFIISPRLAFLLNKLGYDVEAMDNVRVFLERRKNMLYSPGDYTRDKYKIGYDTEWDRKKGYTDTTHLNEGITALEIRERPTKYMLQLTYWRFNNLLDIQPSSKAKYIRASTEPFNEEMELSEERLCNWLKHFGINYPSYKPLQIHASGHASGPELMELAAQTGPKALIPIHTENPATFKRELGKDIKVFIPELGEPIQI